MAMESNRPMQRVYNGGDGIWDGAAWGLAAGAGATATAYGASMYGAQHMSTLRMNMASRAQNRLLTKNKDVQPNERKYGEVQRKLTNINKRADKFVGAMDSVHNAGKTAFKGKRGLATAGAGLLGGMIIGGAVDYMN
ncbi:hypothetical protein [Bacillus tropicus]|uniref:hypothetical protein n=1 Tax=Bacillus tropicus TaxID=2026188 RepID=UPI0021D3609F|nr:hypothetical protein [Bacillus tropicus]MCU5224203.1 hypothetical protein [Bacillus tropicus]